MPPVQANLRVSNSLERLDVPRRESQETSIAKNGPSIDPQDNAAAHASYYAASPMPFPAVPIASPPIQPGAPVLDLQDLTSPERRRRKRERAATFVNDEEARLQLQKQLQDQEAAAKGEERAQKRREKESREARRRSDRREALARLQAQEALEVEVRTAKRSLEEARELQNRETVTGDTPSLPSSTTMARATQSAKEADRVTELEAEVQRLRRELEEAKTAQRLREDQASIASRHVHFAPTPPLLDIPPAEVSFLSISSSNSSIPLPPPPPPPAIEKPAKHTVSSLLAARRAAGQSQPTKKPANAVGMPLDMGKFLHEMKTAKLRKVGLPDEGSKKPKRDEEEHGIKSVLGKFYPLASPHSQIANIQHCRGCSKKEISEQRACLCFDRRLVISFFAHYTQYTIAQQPIRLDIQFNHILFVLQTARLEHGHGYCSPRVSSSSQKLACYCLASRTCSRTLRASSHPGGAPSVAFSGLIA